MARKEESNTELAEAEEPIIMKTEEAVFADKAFYELNVKLKHCFANEKIVLKYRNQVPDLLTTKLKGIRVKEDDEFIPLYFIRLCLDGDVPFEVFGSENTKSFAHLTRLTNGFHGITQFMYCFISRCIDKGMYGILFLINEGDLAISKPKELKERLLKRFDQYVEAPGYNGILGIKPYPNYISHDGRVSTTDSEVYVNAWRYDDFGVSKLTNLLMYCDVSSVNPLKFCAFIRKSSLGIIRAAIYSCTPIPRGEVFVVLGPGCSSTVESLVTSFAEDRFINIVKSKDLDNKDKTRFQLIEKRKTPVFKNPDEINNWTERLLDGFLFEQKKLLGIPLPKLEFETETGIKL